MSNPVTPIPHPAPDQRVISCLERMLDEAKAGTLRAFIASVVHHNPGDVPGAVSTRRAGYSTISSMLFSIERSKLRLMGFVEDVDIELDLAGTNADG